ncbi:MAG TPA: taurine dioxygenase, partial [Rhodospirillaceae bacterium]|nr:taurine dioxygenase [Rhodospirillaceae bacterium]
MAELAHNRDYPFEINRLSEPAGAEIVGLDLSNPIDDDMRDALMDALLENHVLAIREQDLTSDQQMALTARFGTPESHVFHDAAGEKGPQVHVVNNLDADGKPSSRPATFGSFFWHTDKSYHEIPSLATFLHARELPPGGGGDTEFANMYRAYDTLDDETRNKIEGLRAFHSWEANRRNTGNRPATEEEKKLRP